MTEVLKIDSLHKHFGNLHVLRGVDLKVAAGQTVVIIGGSGSGKSTLLRCVNFLELPTGGSISLNGQLVGEERKDANGKTKMVYRESDLVPIRARVGMVFQQFNLFPHMTALGNVMCGLTTVLRQGEADARRAALAKLERVGLAEKANEYPSRLSGGQQQRVAIARALAMQPEIMLFDEATSALDPELVGEVLLTMRSLRDEGVTMMIVTHELGFAFNVADHIVLLHEGRIHEQGTPQQLLLNPEMQKTREFIQSHHLFALPSGQNL